MALERKIWATPAKTLADVLLRGEIALFNENGVMEHLDNPEALLRRSIRRSANQGRR